uniref:Protein quiver n=1 Tax=Globodera rostochiensis TaxID=31243 RepID=A0A914I970_GLORO
MPSSLIVAQRVLVLTIAAVLVDFMPSVDALHCSIGAKTNLKFSDDLLLIMQFIIPSNSSVGKMEALNLLINLDGITKCPAWATRCMTGRCTFDLNSLPKEAASIKQIFGERYEVTFSTCAPEKGCNADALVALDAEIRQRLNALQRPDAKNRVPFPNSKEMAPYNCTYSCCAGNMCNGAIGLLVHKCGTFATILATFYAFFFLRYM